MTLEPNRKAFGEYYRTETNRRLVAIENHLQTLLNFRAQTLILSAVFSSGISLMVTVIITVVFKSWLRS